MRPELGIAFIILLAGLAIAYGRLFLQRRHDLQRLKKLEKQIQFFLENPSSPSYSLIDDNLSSLENAVSDLQNRLVLTEDKALRESQNSSDFVADISHQLKTPLSAMRLYCELDAGQCQHSSDLLELITRLEKLVQSLLLIEKLKSNSYQLKFKICEINALISHVWSELQQLYPERTLNISGDARLRVDADWMSEAILNVLKNACEHAASNPAIEISIIKAEASVMIAIADHGGGVPEADLTKIFNRFHRSANNPIPGHTGLGLAITRSIIEKHHGTIFVDNQGDGLCLTICLPILDGSQTY